jgi:hypothetical protein
MQVERLAREHPGHVFIGGVAVYLHAINNPRTRDLAEASHVADFMLALADFADLRDTDEVVANRRLSKHRLIRDGVECYVSLLRQVCAGPSSRISPGVTLRRPSG